MFSILPQFPILFVMNALMGILILTIYYGKSDKSARFWGLSAISLGSAFFLVIIREFTPIVLSFFLVNFLTLYALVLQHYSIQYLVFGKIKQKIWPEIFCLLFALGYLALLPSGNQKYITPYAGLGTGIVNFWVFWQVKQASKKIKNSYVNLLAYLFLATAIIWIARIFLSQIFRFNSLTDESIVNWLTMICITLLIISRHISYLTIRLTMASQNVVDLNENAFNLAIAAEAQKAEISNKKAEEFEKQLLSSLNALAMARDNETGNHIVRTQHYVKLLAERLRANGHYRDQLTDVSIDALFRAAPLHDLGKIGIPDAILKKAGSLSEAEWEFMKTHTLIGESVLNTVDIERNDHSDVIAKAILIAGGHHERWNGQGYPRGLAGENIPLEARIMSVADMYDALVSERVYKKEWTHLEAVQEVIRNKGIYFDPLIVDAFIAEQQSFQSILNQYRDEKLS